MSHRPHRSAAQWQKLIDRQARSSYSAARFCRRHDIGYASFMQWRKRLSTPALSTVEVTTPQAVPHFIELTGNPETRDPLTRTESDEPRDGNAALLIELDLGNGVQLRISRGG